MKKEILHQLEKEGFVTLSQVINKQDIEYLTACLSKLKISSAVSRKKSSTYGVRNLLNLVPEIREFTESEKIKSLVENILNENAQPVRAIFFDKTSEANWKVPWHQDLTIAVKEKRPTEKFTAWTQKANI
jgi:Asp-tRNA(Asn)/Glu-tRNA(Gln) amidotransferase B subunit